MNDAKDEIPFRDEKTLQSDWLRQDNVPKERPPSYIGQQIRKAYALAPQKGHNNVGVPSPYEKALALRLNWHTTTGSDLICVSKVPVQAEES
jgi:hypothetical protein